MTTAKLQRCPTWASGWFIKNWNQLFKNWPREVLWGVISEIFQYFLFKFWRWTYKSILLTTKPFEEIFNFGPQKCAAGILGGGGELLQNFIKFFGEFNSRISIDNHVCNEVLRLSGKYEAKILIRVRYNTVFDSFFVQLLVSWHVSCWLKLDTVRIIMAHNYLKTDHYVKTISL